jgi:hypothetical protein
MASSRESNLPEPNLFLPAILPATSVSLAALRDAGEGLPVVIAALRCSCDLVEESSKMRAKVRVLSRI